MGKFRTLGIPALFIAAAVVICLAVYVVFSSRAARHNANAFNDSDLVPIRVEVPVESNAFFSLLKATNELYWPETSWRRLSDLSDNTNWDDALAADVLGKNRRCLDSFEAAMQQPYLLVPQPRSFDDDDSYLTGWREISRVEAIKAIVLFRERKERDAIDSALEIVQFGERVENSGGPIIHYLVGAGIKSIGLQIIRQINCQSTLQGKTLVGVLDSLNAVKANPQGFTNALKVEYKMDRDYIDNLAAGNVSNYDQPVLPFRLNLFFNPTATKKKFAQAFRVFRDNVSKPYGGIPWSELPVVATNASAWQLVVGGNFIGEMVFELLEPSLNSFAARECRENVEVAATQLLLALKVYKMRNGKLPESLSALVPDFFQSVPIDDFDGKPMRYLPDQKLIYSVGPDLKDSGGAARRDASDEYDLPFKIEF